MCFYSIKNIQIFRNTQILQRNVCLPHKDVCPEKAAQWMFLGASLLQQRPNLKYLKSINNLFFHKTSV